MVDSGLSFKTESFLLIPTKDYHFDDLYTVASDPVIWKQHPESNRWEKEVFSRFFQSALNNDLGCFTIVSKKSDDFIGSTRFYSYDKKDKSIKVGYTFLSREYWGTSANLEIKKVMLDYIFEYVEQVYFEIGAENFRSRKATQKLGAVKYKKSDNGGLVYLLHKSDYLLQFW